MKKILIILSIIIGFASCGDTQEIVFSESQPKNISLRKTYPIKLRGKYLSLEGDRDTLAITKKYVLEISADTFKVDTIFILSDSLAITNYKNYYYLNLRLEESKWWVFPFKLDKDTLFIFNSNYSDTSVLDMSYVSKSEIFNKEDSTTTITYYAKPSRKEFLEILKKGFFGEPQKMIKVE